ncbi:MAG: bifunctional phosphoribosylaminoimidazolecarboxamide formyltransferase/IMP cyclohydrolase [Myxococcota bacterium]
MTMYPPAPGTVRRALVSVFDKRGLLELGLGLIEQGVAIVATEGSAQTLTASGIPVEPLGNFLRARTLLGGRLKTLHPGVHAGLLADRRDEGQLAELTRAGYAPIDLVICNMAPFREAAATARARAELMAAIDVGGPALLRTGASNAEGGVTVVCDPADYGRVVAALREESMVPAWLRGELAAKAFSLVAEYDASVASWLGSIDSLTQGTRALPNRLPPFVKRAELRYGENPHQAGALFVEEGTRQGIAHGRLLAGKPLSYNNFLDMDAAYRVVSGLGGTACAIVAHTNPCGLAVTTDQALAFRRAVEGDPMAAYGVVVAFNAPVTLATAGAIRDSEIFIECIVAPGFAPAVREFFSKRVNLRLYEAPPGDPVPATQTHRIGGGLLVEESDRGLSNPEEWSCATEKQPETTWVAELAFALRAVSTLTSNAVAITRERQLIGVGLGQLSRVDAVDQALRKAGLRARGAFLASDGFLPFVDSVELAARAGIAAIVQPGGSKRDQELIDACDREGIVMLFTGRRHFRL